MEWLAKFIVGLVVLPLLFPFLIIYFIYETGATVVAKMK